CFLRTIADKRRQHRGGGKPTTLDRIFGLCRGFSRRISCLSGNAGAAAGRRFQIRSLSPSLSRTLLAACRPRFIGSRQLDTLQAIVRSGLPVPGGRGTAGPFLVRLLLAFRCLEAAAYGTLPTSAAPHRGRPPRAPALGLRVSCHPS